MQSYEEYQLESILSKLPPSCRQQYDRFFCNPSNKKQSSLHKQKCILINTCQTLGSFLQTSQIQKLQTISPSQYYNQKSYLITILIYLCQRFNLNCKFLKQSSIPFSHNQLKEKQIEFMFDDCSKGSEKVEVPFLMYLIGEVYESFAVGNSDDGQVVSATQAYRQSLCRLYYMIALSNPIPTLPLITQLLSGNYHSHSLSFQMISTSFRLIEAGIQQRNIFPYLYFIQNSPINAIKVLYNNPKWIFSKGITIYTWFEMQAVGSQQSQCTLFILKTDLNNAIKIKLLKSLDIVVSSVVNNKQIQTAKISFLQHKIKPNQITMMGIQLQVLQGGFLKSTTYSLNIRINSSFYKQTIISSQKMPKFTNNDLISDFILFDKFIGKVYSIIISNKNELNAYEKLAMSFTNYGICNEAQVWSLVDSGVLKKENIVGIFNAERSFEGILINYVGEKNLACFSGLVSRQKYNKYDYQIIDVLMPYLYMLIVHYKSSHYQDKSTFQQLFDLILKQIIKIISNEQREEDFIPCEDILFILYFLQLSEYAITQSTLNYLLEEVRNSHEKENIYFQLIGEFLDYPLIIHKGMNLNNQESSIQSINPAKKTQLLFLLQSKWDAKWTTQFQSFSSWWSPPFFNYQNNQQFNPKKFLYNQTKESRIQWQVRNFISNDLCKCILSPVFKNPQYSQIKRYQKQYVGKECFLEDFMLDLGNIKKGKKTVLKKTVTSTLDRMKKKILGKEVKTKDNVAGQKTILLTKKNVVKSQMMSQCLFIDLLTVIMSTVRLSKSGFITITSKHLNNTFDHMCVKAFLNDYFLHITFHLRQILFIRKRRFNQQNRTLEIRLKSGRIYLLHFYLNNIDEFINNLEQHVNIKKDPYMSYLQSKQPFKWIEKQMSNFEYIQWLNDVAGRNYIDIAQYPIFPWVFVTNSNVEKKQLNIYRDLVKNMGSHGSNERIQHFMQKYSSNNQQQLFNEYHFGTHYSSSAIIFNYLIRLRPFSIGSMTLQSGKFDCADRIFASYIGSWHNATNSPTDIRQLIPQIYTIPEMYININNYDYGMTQDKVRIDNVQLPLWAIGNPYKFVAKIRKQLQSPYVSENINHWVDLIFGYKQRGKAAIQHMNIFFPLTYQDSINLDTVTDPEERVSYQTQIAHFGQNPSQIIGNNPHPIRIKSKANWQQKLFSDGGAGILIQRCNLQGKSKLSSLQRIQKFLYRSIFQSKNSIMSIKFLDDFHFIVIRKEQYFIFRILQKKSQFISKQQQVSYQLESTEISINYQQLGHYVPTTTISSNIVALGGFFNGYIHFLFIDQYKCNQALKFQGLNTITAIQYCSKYQLLYLADNEGYLKVYQINFLPTGGKVNLTNTKQIQFIEVNSIKVHELKINAICVNEKANLMATCSQDGFVKVLNLYSQQLIRIYRNPDYQFGTTQINSILFCKLSISPLYSISFYSEKSKKIYSYSINGQFLAAHSCLFTHHHHQHEKEKETAEKQIDNENIQQSKLLLRNKQEFIYNMAVLPTSNTTERLVYLTSTKDIYILQLPFLQQKRKIKLKKDAHKISCFESCQNGKISLTGTQDGSVQIVADPSCY